MKQTHDISMPSRNVHYFMLHNDTELLESQTSPLQVERVHHLIAYDNDGIDEEYHESSQYWSQPLNCRSPSETCQYKEEYYKRPHEYSVRGWHPSAVDLEA